MAVEQRQRPTAEDYVQELQQIILGQFPEAEFKVHRLGRKDYRLLVYGDFGDSFDVIDLISERRTDILVDAGIHIVVLPLGPREELN